MPVPKKVTADHVRLAMREIDQKGLRSPSNRSVRFDLLDSDGNRYPPKHVIAIACEIATGRYLGSNDLDTHEAQIYLRKLGFKIVEKEGSGQEFPNFKDVKPGDKLTNTQMSRSFGVGNGGGMRFSSENRHLVVVADHTKGLYEDRWEEDVLWLTGTGPLGAQRLIGQNKRLAEQPDTGLTVHAFEVFRRNQYVYIGEVSLAGAPRSEQQIDAEENPRKVYIFPLRLTERGTKPIPPTSDIIANYEKRAARRSNFTLAELERRARLSGKKKPSRRKTYTYQYERSADVVKLAKTLANGKCDLCGKAAPFKFKSAPFLECHHLIHLADGGADVIDNAVALCPNCHRKMHRLDLKPDRRKLFGVISGRARAET